MEGLGWHYSHSKGRVVYGHCLVSGQYRTGGVSFPCDFESYVPEKAAIKQGRPFRTKIDLAKELINRFMPLSSETVYCILDSWFTAKEVITAGLEKGFHIIGALKGNRVFKLQEHGSNHRLSVYAQNMRNASCEEITINDAAFMVKRLECWLPKIGRVVVLVSKRKKDRSKRYILSTDMTLSNEEILRYYSYRWDIEVGYLYCKDRLGMGQYQMRSLKAIEKFCALVFSAFGYLESLRVLSNASSIGQSRWCFTMKRKRQYVDRIADLVRKGVSMREIYKELKLVA